MDVSAATLSVVVKNTGIAETQAQLDALGKTGDRVAGKFDAAFKQSSASAMDFARAGASANQIAMLTGQSLSSAKDAVQRFGGQAAKAAGELHGLALAQQEMSAAGIQAATVSTRLTESVARSSQGLGTLRSSLASTVTAMSGLPPQLTMITSQLGVMSAGFVPVIAALAAIGAGLAVWKLWTEEARKTAETQDKAFESLKQFNNEARQGFGGKMAEDLKTVREELSRLQLEINKTKIQTTPSYNAGGPGGSPFAGAGGVGFVDQIKALFGMSTSADDLQKKTAEVAKEVAEGQVNVAAKYGLATGAIALQIQRQAELNAAFGKGALALDLINHKFDYLDDVLKHTVGTTKEEQAALDALSATMRVQRDEASRNSTGWNEMQRKARELAADLPAMQKAFDALQPTMAKVNEYMQALGNLQAIVRDTAPSVIKGLYAQAAANKVLTDKQQKETADKITAAQKYQDDVRQIYATGLEKIITDGTKSWHDFFDDVFQMFSKLMDRMQKEGKNTGLLGGLSAAIGGGVAGFQIGQSTGSTAGGLLGGAASGAMLGNQILPGGWGAAIGGLTGAAGGLLGAAQAHKEAAQKLAEASVNLAKNIAAFGATSGLQQSIAGVKAQADSLRDVAFAIRKEYNESHSAGAGTRENFKEYQASLAAINAAEAVRIQQLKDEDHLIRANFLNDQQVRQLRAHGLNAEADALAEQLARGKELQDAIKQFGASSEEVAQLMITQAMEMNNAAFAAFSTKNQAAFAANIQAMNDKIAADKAAQDELRQIAQEQLDVQQEALSVASKQLDLQQKTVDGLRQTVDALRKYQDSLKLSNLSPLSANDRYLEAKRQYDIVAKAAAGGDQGAAQNLPQVANAFLTESKAMFGSSGRFAQDFAQVQTLTSLLGDQFDAQLTVEDKILAELKIQTSAMSYQIAVLTAQLHQSAYDAALARQTYVVGSPKDPNFLVQNGVPGAVTGLPPWDPMSPTGMALAASMSGGGGSSGGGPRDTSMAAFTSWKAKHSGAGDEASWGMTYDDWISIGSPSFARGGSFGGGARLVGERGPELEITGPSRIAPLSALGEATTDEVKKLNVMIAALLVETKNQTKAINRKRELAGTN